MAIELIAHAYLSSDSSNIDFTNIPDTYKDLILVMSLRDVYTGSYTPEFVNLKINNNTNNQHSYWWTGTAGSSAAGSGGYSYNGLYAGRLCRKGAWDSNFSVGYVLIPGANDGDGTGGSDNYTPTIIGYSGCMKASTLYGFTNNFAWSRKAETDRVSRITISSNSGSNLEAKSTATLYGVTGS